MSTGKILINPQFLSEVKNKDNTISVFGVLFAQSAKALSKITTDDFDEYKADTLYSIYSPETAPPYHTIIKNDILKVKISPHSSIASFSTIFLTYTTDGSTNRADQKWAFAVKTGASGYVGDISAIVGAGLDVEVDMNGIEGLCCRFVNFNYPDANSYFHKHWAFNLYDDSDSLKNLTNSRDLLDKIKTRLKATKDTLHLTNLDGGILSVGETLIASDGNIYNSGVGVSIVKNATFYNDPNNLAIIKATQIARKDATDILIKKQP